MVGAGVYLTVSVDDVAWALIVHVVTAAAAAH
jgi:hypothetical protein